jgi:hypothetical protein
LFPGIEVIAESQNREIWLRRRSLRDDNGSLTEDRGAPFEPRNEYMVHSHHAHVVLVSNRRHYEDLSVEKLDAFVLAQNTSC